MIVMLPHHRSFPKKENSWEASVRDQLKKIEPTTGNKHSIFSFWRAIPAPPLLAKTIGEIISQCRRINGFSNRKAVARREKRCIRILAEDDTLEDVISFPWVTSKGLIYSTPCAISSKKKVAHLPKRLSRVSALQKDAIDEVPSLGATVRPIVVTYAMINLRITLED